MKFLRFAAIGVTAAILSACGGHGYEGDWKVDSNNATINATLNQLGKAQFTLGSDYIEANGKRTKMDEIFVRESGGKVYLVMKKSGEESVIEIIDENTLQESMGMFSIKFIRQ